MIDTMARARRLVTGTHEYLPERGFARGNYIWVRTMQQALLQAILSSLAQGVVADIRLILDRKSLAAATERFMRDRVGAMLPFVQDQLAQMLVEYPAGAAQIAAYQNNLQANGIVFEWGNPESIDGLWLAHRLALLSRRELHEQPETSLFDALARFGNRSAPIDVTDSVTGEISRAAIERWRRDTGLPVPRG